MNKDNKQQRARLACRAKAAGWAAKLGPGDLEQILDGLNMPTDDRLIVGADTADDAGVYRLDDDTALVLTVDLFTPIVDDPYTFGAVAAANSLSDVYAMGGRPLAALNVCCFPPREDKALLRDILKGGADKVAEAGAVIAGGHSVRDEELKYGLAVTGVVHPDRVITNAGARPGDRLVLTKPIGTGLLSTARKSDKIDESEFSAAVGSMLELNMKAAGAMAEAGARACTDVTGFGLLGHACEMAQASAVGLAISFPDVPLLPLATECAKKELIPGGTKNNREHYGKYVKGEGEDTWWPILYDPQTSGGLLISIAEEKADALLEGIRKAGDKAWLIGEVLEGPAGQVVVRM